MSRHRRSSQETHPFRKSTFVVAGGALALGAIGIYEVHEYYPSHKTDTAAGAPAPTASSPAQITSPSSKPSPQQTEARSCQPGAKDILTPGVRHIIDTTVRAINTPPAGADVLKNENGLTLQRHLSSAILNTQVVTGARPKTHKVSATEAKAATLSYWKDPESGEPSVTIEARLTPVAQIEVHTQQKDPNAETGFIPHSATLCSDGAIFNEDTGTITPQVSPARVRQWTEDLAVIFDQAVGSAPHAPTNAHIPPALRG